MSIFLVFLFILLELGKGIWLLKTLPFLTAKLHPLSKPGASKGSYLQDSFRTTQLIPSLQRIKNLAFATNGELGNLKIVVISGFLIVSVILIVIVVSHFVNRSKVNKVNLQLGQKWLKPKPPTLNLHTSSSFFFPQSQKTMVNDKYVFIAATYYYSTLWWLIVVIIIHYLDLEDGTSFLLSRQF